MRHPVLLLCALTACSRPGDDLPPIVTAFSGVVSDAATGEPLADVSISTEPATEAPTTDGAGSYAIASGIEPQRFYRVSASKVGYLTAQATFSAVEGGSAVVDLQLTAARPLLGVSRSELDFDSRDTQLTFAVENRGERQGTFDYSIVSSAGFVTSVSPTTGTVGDVPEVVTVSVDRALLGTSYGEFSATLDLTSSAGSAIVITKIVNPNPTQPLLAVSPNRLEFGEVSSQRSFVVRNLGTGELSWSVAQLPAFASADTLGGTLGSGARQTVVITIDRAQLSGEETRGAFAVQATSGAVTSVPMEYLIYQPASAQTELSASELVLAPDQTSATFEVRNRGSARLVYRVLPSSAPWLSISSPPPGEARSLAPGAAETVTLALAPSGLPTGLFQTNVFVRSDVNELPERTAGGNRALTVSLTIPAASELQVLTSSLAFGTSPGPLTVTLRYAGPGSSVWFSERPTWLIISPSEGIIDTPAGAPPQDVQLSVSVDHAALALAGPFAGVLRIGSTTGALVTIPITGVRPGVRWRAVSPPSPPGARYGGAMAYSTASSDVLLFGGFPCAGLSCEELWRFDPVLETWSEELGESLPPARVGARLAPTLAGDSLALVGGGSESQAVDAGFAWLRTGDSDFTIEVPCTFVDPLTATCKRNAALPFERMGVQYLGSSGVGALALYGGFDGAGGTTDKVTRVNSFDAIPAWIEGSALPCPMRDVIALPATGALGSSVSLLGFAQGGSCEVGLVAVTGPVAGAAGTYSLAAEFAASGSSRYDFGWFERAGRAYYFGGRALTNVMSAALFEWDPQTQTITELNAGPGPSARVQPALAYDSVRDQGVLFGGVTTGGVVNDTWVLEFYQ